MTAKLKALGLALVAVLAMSAVVAAGAQAEAVEHTFKSATSPTDLTGVVDGPEPHVFTIDKGSVETVCEEILFEGTEVGKELDEVTITPTYDKCESAPFGKATVTENHCAYVFDSDTTTHPAEGALHAPVAVECASGNTIDINVPSVGVTVHVGTQSGLHGVRYTNVVENEKEAVTVDATVEGIAWTCTPAFLCGLGGVPTSGTDGTYTGQATVTGYEDDGEPQEGTAKTTPNLSHETQVDVTMTTP